MEEKQKAKTNKETLQKKSTKSTTSKKPTKKTPTKKSSSPKTNAIIKEETKPKKSSTKQEVKKEIVLETDSPKEESEKSILLEKTIIFDGIQNQNLADVVSKLEEDKVILDDKIIKRSKIKKVIIIILAILMIGVVGITTKYIVDNIAKHTVKETINSNIYKKVSRKYRSVSKIKETEDKNIFKEIKYDNIKTISLSDFEKKAFQKEDMIVLIASTSCYSCLTFEPIIDEVFGNLDKTIYRINISSMTEKENEKFRGYYAYSVTPTIFIVKDGVVTQDITGLMTSEELTNWLNKKI